jgi:hypothetical protein
MSTNSKFSDGSSSAFAELPVPAAYLSWTRGNAQLRQIAQNDPGAYFGGWRAFTLDRDGNALPFLPIPIVERVSEDGKHPYNVYASNVISFLPIQHRTRFELRQKTKDEQTGKEYDRIVSISQERRQGYAPYRQVFGLVFNRETDEHSPAVLKVWKWSTFITFERAGQAWNKVVVPEGQVLIRRYGSLGIKENEILVPNFEVYGQGRSTPIEAIGLSKPRFVGLTPEFDDLWEKSQAWKNCERWNAEGKVMDEDTASAKSLFIAKCEEMGLSNIETEQLVAEAKGDYKQALANVSIGEEDLNEKLAIAETEDFPY